MFEDAKLEKAYRQGMLDACNKILESKGEGVHQRLAEYYAQEAELKIKECNDILDRLEDKIKE